MSDDALQKLLGFMLFPGEPLDSAINRAIDLYILSTPVHDILRHVTMLVYCRDFNVSLTANQRKMVEQLIKVTMASSDWSHVRRQFRMISARRCVKRALNDAQMVLFNQIEQYTNAVQMPMSLPYYMGVR